MKRKLVKLTRSAYKRKIIMFGVSIFMSLALTATGFAAWVLSKDAKVQTEGGIEVGAVTEANVEIKDLVFSEKDVLGEPIKNFVFEPLASDTTGRVRYDGESKPEDMDIMLQWKVVNYQNVDNLFVDFKIPATVKAAIDLGYIALPESFAIQQQTETIGEQTYYVAKYDIGNTITATGASDDGLLSYTVTDDAGVRTVVFTMKVQFLWGATFGGVNPGLYYDSAEGNTVAYDTVKATLNQFKATIHGITYDAAFEAKTEAQKDELYTQNPIDKYYFIVNATVA